MTPSSLLDYSDPILEGIRACIYDGADFERGKEDRLKDYERAESALMKLAEQVQITRKQLELETIAS